MSLLLDYVKNQLTAQSKHPKFKAGDTVTVSYKIKEGDKERIQQFTGVVIQRTSIAWFPASTGSAIRPSSRMGLCHIGLPSTVTAPPRHAHLTGARSDRYLSNGAPPLRKGAVTAANHD